MNTAYRVLGWLIVATVAVQAGAIALAYFGLGAWIRDGGVLDRAAMVNHTADFPGVTGFAIHGIGGELVVPAITVTLLVVAVFAKVPGGVAWAGALVVLVAAQVPLGLLSSSLPALGSVHGLLAIGLAMAAGAAARRVPHSVAPTEVTSSLAGVAPSTRQSGKSRLVGFRWVVDRQLRDALVEWAGDSRLSSPWAADVYGRARARGHDHPHAVRVLARAWVYVIWRCWQDGVAYDPSRHGGFQRLGAPASAA